MGLKLKALEILSKIKFKRVLSLGYPDLLVGEQDIKRLFNVTPTKYVNNGRWHGKRFELPETVEFFGLIGASIDCVDVHASRGCEKIVDLNIETDLGKYDLVIDPGTIEHCFNIGQALINAANAVDVGGRILHTSPVSMINHGFYNINPTLFHDFYTQNGWVEELCLLESRLNEYLPISGEARVLIPSECSVYFMAKRVTDAALAFPTQSKYLKNPELRTGT